MSLFEGVDACARTRPLDIVLSRRSIVRALCAEREELKDLRKRYDKSEDDLKALQSVGQIIGELLRQLDEERCKARRLDFDFCARSGALLQCAVSARKSVFICSTTTFAVCQISSKRRPARDTWSAAAVR